MSHSKRRQNAVESLQGDGLYVKGKHECERTQDKSFGDKQRKKSKSKEHKKTMECYKCNQKGHFKKDCLELKKSG